MRRVLSFLVVGLAAASLSESSYEFLFSKWVTQHQRKYATSDFSERFSIWKANLDMIMKHNEGNHSYDLGMNEFGDLSWEEFKATFMGFQNDKRDVRNLHSAPATEGEKFADIDWRLKGAVTPVKNQGQCGSCWAFSATGAWEGAYQIAKGELISFSEQHLVDCSTTNNGCKGGLMDRAFDWWIKNGGACREADYNYTARQGACRQCQGVATPGGYVDVDPRTGETGLEEALQHGPVSVAIEADQSSFQFYRSGVFQGPCGTNLDHGVLLVGSVQNYWIVKNSWGDSWGEKGYIHMVKGQNLCGISMAASRPTA